MKKREKNLRIGYRFKILLSIIISCLIIGGMIAVSSLPARYCLMRLLELAAIRAADVGTAFSTLAYVSMQRLFYHELRDKRQPEMVSLDQGCGDDEDPAMDFLMAKLCAENVLDENTLCLALDFETYLSTENPMRQKIMRLMLSGFNGCDIAKAVGCTTQNVSRIKLAVAKNFANWMEGRKQNG